MGFWVYVPGGVRPLEFHDFETGNAVGLVHLVEQVRVITDELYDDECRLWACHTHGVVGQQAPSGNVGVLQVDGFGMGCTRPTDGIEGVGVLGFRGIRLVGADGDGFVYVGPFVELVVSVEVCEVVGSDIVAGMYDGIGTRMLDDYVSV